MSRLSTLSLRNGILCPFISKEKLTNAKIVHSGVFGVRQMLNFVFPVSKLTTEYGGHNTKSDTGVGHQNDFVREKVSVSRSRRVKATVVCVSVVQLILQHTKNSPLVPSQY